MFGKKRVDPYMMEEIKRLVWTVGQFSQMSCIQPLDIKIQGKHPITGGTSVVRADLRVNSVNDVKFFLHNLLFGIKTGVTQDFITRVKEKVVDGYACCIEVNGQDQDGDSLSYVMKLKTQNKMIDLMENGIFSLDNKDHHKFKLIGE